MRGVTIGPHRPPRVVVGFPTTKTGGGAHHRLRAVSAERGLSGGNGGNGGNRLLQRIEEEEAELKKQAKRVALAR